MRSIRLNPGLLLAACLVAGACSNEPLGTHGPVVVDTDVAHFWEAYDLIVATRDTARQAHLLDSVFLERGTPGLAAMMERRAYTPTSYLDAIRAYPEFWASVRPLTLRSQGYAAEIEAATRRLRELYPPLRPARVYFTVGALMTPGMTLDDVVFIGSELAMADSSVVTHEFPPRLGENLRAYFDTNPIRSLAFLNVHEYVHTQQGPFGSDLLAVALQEGVAEFVATLTTGQDSPTPAVAFGEENERAVRERFAQEMFSPNVNDWLYNDFSNDFGVRDLGYYVGYAIAEAYHQQTEDGRRAVAELIELDYQDPAAVRSVVDASGYFERPMAELREAYDAAVPRVVSVEPLDADDTALLDGPAHLSFTFSTPMNPRFRGFDYGPLGDEHVLRVEQVIGWSDDGRTLTIEVDAVPGRRQQLLLTSQFRSRQGPALEPYLIDLAHDSSGDPRP